VTAKALALTMGDPAGIGPEIIVKAWSALRSAGPAFVVIGDHDLLAAQPGAGALPLRRVASAAEAAEVFETALPVLDRPVTGPVVAGKPSPANAPAVISWIETGAGMVLSGQAAALVTAPIAKEPLHQAGFEFPGHTEFLGALTRVQDRPAPRGPVMMLTSGDLRTVLVTIHEPLSKVPSLLSVDRIVEVGAVTAQALTTDFGIERPRLAVAGLNPHAGEEGSFGREEIEIIAPACRALAERGIEVIGPRPSDSLFHPEARAGYDAVVCMYHDQALIPVKMLDFWGGVNLTLGLKIVRTSPDHGTGFDIAGRGLARPDSLIAAIGMAAANAARRAAVLGK
jgi:4-hydroxythreonine-4-phosphate dehydrogenase